MTNPTLGDLIADGRVHVMDGAMGTMLYNRGVFVNVCYDELNLTQPELIERVHAEYVESGAEILETNTFGANPIKLSSYALEDKTEAINAAAVVLAQKAANGRASVVGAIGPLGIRIEPFGPTARQEAIDFFRRQTTGLLEGGVDGFVLETFSDIDELHAAFEAVRGLTDLPIIAQMTIGEDGNTSYGTAVETIGKTVTEWGADVVGFNCSVGPATMLDAIERIADTTDRPLSASPNAGIPRAVGDRKIYLASPEYLAQYARRLIDAGARFVGGCCGTTPEHIKLIRDHVASLQPRTSHGQIQQIAASNDTAVSAVPLGQRSNFGKKLAAGEFVTSVEILPASGWQSDTMIAQARALEEAGVDAVTLLDSPRQHSRMGIITAAIIIEREVGVETLMHYTCRDRNMLGMMSDLLGAAASGLRNILIVSGDPPTTGPYPDATAVFDIDSIGLANVVNRLNHGLDPGGNPIGEPTRYVMGVAANQGAVHLDREVKRFGWKIEAGADFVVTQPVFDPGRLEAFLAQTREWPIPIVAGIWPFASLRNAEFLANEVPGVHVPQEVIRRMSKAQSRGPESAAAEGVKIAKEMFDAVAGTVQGVHIATPAGKVDLVLQLLELL
ncbi:MAG: bifunctional homocysteine S-methyltransferase/methylenetetrahydrofolate reductase [Gemmatimonadetes bacterium]|nr:bifunctional homocysteine S-methyltransferase/methylenetetrahydrofolate reductase [Gemmatimonadota bacterium]